MGLTVLDDSIDALSKATRRQAQLRADLQTLRSAAWDWCGGLPRSTAKVAPAPFAWWFGNGPVLCDRCCSLLALFSNRAADIRDFTPPSNGHARNDTEMELEIMAARQECTAILDEFRWHRRSEQCFSRFREPSSLSMAIRTNCHRAG